MGSKSNFEANFSQEKSLNNWLKTAFLRLIAEEIGLEIKKHDQSTLDAKILSRMKALKISFPEDYYQLLASKTIESRQEWQNLVLLLTNPESFFFRDKGHFQLLERHIIPELIQRKQNHRTLRICSAGCSTGEEPYSLAILLKELIPDPEQWDLLILGLDVNSLSLEKAKAGIYRPWSFRTVAPEIKKRYFKVINGEYHIDLEIKRMSKFQTLNLVKDSFPNPNSEMREMDLIICRNVFIYFEEAAISKVLEKFYQTLQPDGYLLTGHTELYTQDLSKFEAKVFPEGMIYQCLDPTLIASSPLKYQAYNLASENLDESLEKVQIQEKINIKSNIQEPDFFSISSKKSDSVRTNVYKTNIPSSSEKDLLRSAEVLMQKKAYYLAIIQVEKALEFNPKNFRACYLMAQLCSYFENHEKAEFFCHKALEIDEFSILPYYILANIAEQAKRVSEVKQILKKIIYLEPGSVAAYLKLSYIYQAENDLERTYKMQTAALNILKELPPKMEILELDHLTVTQLILQLEANL
jgi:chemotaxis protein methyltransferase CheR